MVGGGQRAGPDRRLDHDRARGERRDQPVALEEALLARHRPRRHLAHHCALLDGPPEQVGVAGGVEPVDTTREKRDGRRPGHQRTPVRLRVDAVGAARDHREPAVGQAARQGPRHADAVVRAGARTDQGRRTCGQPGQVRIAANPQRQRTARVQVSEPGRPARVVRGQERAAVPAEDGELAHGIEPFQPGRPALHGGYDEACRSCARGGSAEPEPFGGGPLGNGPEQPPGSVGPAAHDSSGTVARHGVQRSATADPPERSSRPVRGAGRVHQPVERGDGTEVAHQCTGHRITGFGDPAPRGPGQHRIVHVEAEARAGQVEERLTHGRLRYAAAARSRRRTPWAQRAPPGPRWSRPSAAPGRRRAG